MNMKTLSLLSLLLLPAAAHAQTNDTPEIMAPHLRDTAMYLRSESGRILLPVQWATTGRMRIRLFDADGETVLDSTVLITAGDLRLELDVASLPAGMYMYKAETSPTIGLGWVLVVCDERRRHNR